MADNADELKVQLRAIIKEYIEAQAAGLLEDVLGEFKGTQAVPTEVHVPSKAPLFKKDGTPAKKRGRPKKVVVEPSEEAPISDDVA